MDIFATFETVPIRDVLPSEAADFTPWLARNLDLLSERLDMELQLESMEAAAGDFSADVVARDLATNQLVVIENQYGSTDHRHLGQIIAYASVLGAEAVIWVTETLRNEHKTAIDFLNRNLTDSLRLYAVEFSVERIGDSRPAMRLNVICRPPEKRVIEVSPAGNEIYQRYQAWFQGLIDTLRTDYQFTKAKAAQRQNWYAFTSENSKVFVYSVSFARHARVRVEIIIETRDAERNKAIFDRLQEDQAAINDAFGEPLSWERLDARQSCRIAVYRDGEIDGPTEMLEDIRKWAVDRLLTFKKVFPERIARVVAGS